MQYKVGDKVQVLRAVKAAPYAPITREWSDGVVTVAEDGLVGVEFEDGRKAFCQEFWANLRPAP